MLLIDSSEKLTKLIENLKDDIGFISLVFLSLSIIRNTVCCFLLKDETGAK